MLIDAVKIGPLVYAVNRAPISEMGICDYEKQTITIRDGLAPEVAKVVLWHEVVHAVLFQLGYTDHDERLVDGLAHSIMSVLIDNPQLIGTVKHKSTNERGKAGEKQRSANQ
jgi:hypothetical protein